MGELIKLSDVTPERIRKSVAERLRNKPPAPHEARLIAKCWILTREFFASCCREVSNAVNDEVGAVAYHVNHPLETMRTLREVANDYSISYQALHARAMNGRIADHAVYRLGEKPILLAPINE